MDLRGGHSSLLSIDVSAAGPRPSRGAQGPSLHAGAAGHPPPRRLHGAQPLGGRSPEPGFQSPAILAVGVRETALDPTVHTRVRPLGA